MWFSSSFPSSGRSGPRLGTVRVSPKAYLPCLASCHPQTCFPTWAALSDPLVSLQGCPRRNRKPPDEETDHFTPTPAVERWTEQTGTKSHVCRNFFYFPDAVLAPWALWSPPPAPRSPLGRRPHLCTLVSAPVKWDHLCGISYRAARGTEGPCCARQVSAEHTPSKGPLLSGVGGSGRLFASWTQPLSLVRTVGPWESSGCPRQS